MFTRIAAGPHEPQLSLADHVAGVRRQRDVQRHEVRTLQKIIEFGRVAGMARRVELVAVRRVEHAHREAVRAPGDGLADLAEADDPQRGVMQVAAEQQRRIPRLPPALAHKPIGFDDAARGREQEREREVGRGLGEDARRVADGDAAGRGGGQIDVVVADGDVADDAEARRRGDERGVDGVGEQTDEAIGIAHALSQHAVGRREIAWPDIDVGVLAQAVERIAGEGAGDEDVWAVGHVCEFNRGATIHR